VGGVRLLRDAVTSQHVYDAVLLAGAATVEDFWRSLPEQGSG
jgi:hypothetical protein